MKPNYHGYCYEKGFLLCDDVTPGNNDITAPRVPGYRVQVIICMYTECTHTITCPLCVGGPLPPL